MPRAARRRRRRASRRLHRSNRPRRGLRSGRPKALEASVGDDAAGRPRGGERRCDLGRRTRPVSRTSVDRLECAHMAKALARPRDPKAGSPSAAGRRNPWAGGRTVSSRPSPARARRAREASPADRRPSRGGACRRAARLLELVLEQPGLGVGPVVLPRERRPDRRRPSSSTSTSVGRLAGEADPSSGSVRRAGRARSPRAQRRGSRAAPARRRRPARAVVGVCR